MRRLIAIAAAIALLFTLAVGTPVVAATVIDVWPGDSIQAAVDIANPGDTVLIHAGEYHQSVVFNSEDSGITLCSDGAILDGNSPADPGTPLTWYYGVRLSPGVSGVTIKGFEIRHYRIGIAGGDVIGNTTGNLIKENKISNNEWGISLYNVSDSEIKENEVTGSTHQGILVALTGSTGNIIKGNKLTDNGWGIQLQYVNNNEVKENQVSGSTYGILVLQSTYNLFMENDIYSNEYGFRIGSADNNEVIENQIASNAYGIYVFGSNGNLIQENQVLGSSFVDLYDDSVPPPLNNTWQNNIYGSANF